MVRKSLLRIAAQVCLLAGISTAAAAAQCDRAPEQLAQRKSLLERIENLENSTPFLEQFDEVKRSVDILHETLQNTRGDVDQVRDRIDGVLGLVREQNKDLQNVRRWARSAYSNSDWESAAPSGASPITLSGGLEASSELIEDIEGLTGEFQGALTVLERAVAAGDGSPSEQLAAFQSYFTALTDKLETYSEIAPMIGVFVEMLEFYGDAIGAIGESVSSIEKGNARRDEILSQLGEEFNNVRYRWPPTTPREQLGRQIQDLVQQLAEVERALEECGVDLNEAAREPASNGLRTEFSRARATAARGCIGESGFSSESELEDRRNDDYARAARYYRVVPPFFPEKYGAELSRAEEIDYIRILNDRWKARIAGAEGALQRAEVESAELERQRQAYARGEIKLNPAQRDKLAFDHSEKSREVAHLKERLDYNRKQAAERDRVVANLLKSQRRLDDFYICVRKGVEGIAGHLGWDPFWIHYYLEDLYYPHFQSDEGDCSGAVGPGISEGFCNTPGGWRISGDAQAGSAVPTHRKAGGGGFIEATDDAAGGVWYWEAPERFKGDLCSFVGGALRFSVRQSATDKGFTSPDVVIESPSGTLAYPLGAAPGTGWTAFEVSLSPDAGWNDQPSRQHFEEILGNVTRLKIRGEFRTGEDVGAMDAVSLIPGNDPQGVANCRAKKNR